MYPFSIGVLMDGFRTDTLTALDKAAAVGAKGIQVYATKGELSPENMNAEARREFLKRVKDHGLVIYAPAGRHGVSHASRYKSKPSFRPSASTASQTSRSFIFVPP